MFLYTSSSLEMGKESAWVLWRSLVDQAYTSEARDMALMWFDDALQYAESHRGGDDGSNSYPVMRPLVAVHIFEKSLPRMDFEHASFISSFVVEHYFVYVNRMDKGIAERDSGQKAGFLKAAQRLRVRKKKKGTERPTTSPHAGTSIVRQKLKLEGESLLWELALRAKKQESADVAICLLVDLYVNLDQKLNSHAKVLRGKLFQQCLQRMIGAENSNDDTGTNELAADRRVLRCAQVLHSFIRRFAVPPRVGSTIYIIPPARGIPGSLRRGAQAVQSYAKLHVTPLAVSNLDVRVATLRDLKRAAKAALTYLGNSEDLVLYLLNDGQGERGRENGEARASSKLGTTSNASNGLDTILNAYKRAGGRKFSANETDDTLLSLGFGEGISVVRVTFLVRAGLIKGAPAVEKTNGATALPPIGYALNWEPPSFSKKLRQCLATPGLADDSEPLSFLSNEPTYLDQIFQVMNEPSTSSEAESALWDIVELMPIDMRMLRAVKVLGIGHQSGDFSVLPANNVHVLFYSLKLIRRKIATQKGEVKPAAYDTSSESATVGQVWCGNFASNGGVAHLLKIVDEWGSVEPTAMRDQCLVELLNVIFTCLQQYPPFAKAHASLRGSSKYFQNSKIGVARIDMTNSQWSCMVSSVLTAVYNIASSLSRRGLNATDYDATTMTPLLAVCMKLVCSLSYMGIPGLAEYRRMKKWIKTCDGDARSHGSLCCLAFPIKFV